MNTHAKFAALLLAITTSGAALAADTYSIDPRHTFPVFEVEPGLGRA